MYVVRLEPGCNIPACCYNHYLCHTQLIVCNANISTKKWVTHNIT